MTALANGDRRLAVDLTIADNLPPLSPAIELAAYRIATEALTNAVRHSDGHACRMSAQAGDYLVITVTDDGEPPARWRPGVGIRSIAERAEELGGSADAGPVAGGWEGVGAATAHTDGAGGLTVRSPPAVHPSRKRSGPVRIRLRTEFESDPAGDPG